MELSTLAPVFEEAGPYVSLTLEVGRATEDADQQREARWRTARSELEGRLPGSVLDEVGERLAENVHAAGDVRRTLVVAGADGGEARIVLDDVQPGPSHWPEVVDVGPLPDLSSWMGVADRGRAFVLVVADRTGADIEVHRSLTAPAEQETEVTGETFYLTKVAAGDWAQKQFQQTAENAWEANAGLVADEARGVAKRLGIRTIVVAGEVRARAEVLRALEDGQHPDRVVVEVESGGRAAGASAEALWTEVRDRLVALDRERDVAVANRLDEARGRGEGAATGLDEVLGALQQHRVERLVLDLGKVRDKVVDAERWPGIALPGSVRGAGELPADRVLVAAGALTDAGLTLLPAAMGRGGGASALLRWS